MLYPMLFPDPDLLTTYAFLFGTILGFGVLVRNLGFIRAVVFAGAVGGIAYLLWLNAFAHMFACMFGSPLC
jgi:hypothetical protein